MSKFADIALRTNGDRIDNTWFDALRAAGVTVETFLGGGFLTETNFALANNQVAAANITGLIVDKTLYKSMTVFAEVRRLTSASEVLGLGRLQLIYRNFTTAWDIVTQFEGDELGIVFSINATTGQVQYTSTNMSGTGYVGTIKFRGITFSV